jgi:hypothetical protein
MRISGRSRFKRFIRAGKDFSNLRKGKKMTTREWLKNELTRRAMSPEQAEEVLKIAIPRIETLVPDYQITWDRSWDEYPPQIYTNMWGTTRPIALEWIDSNIPKAWFRPMFEEN